MILVRKGIISGMKNWYFYRVFLLSTHRNRLPYRVESPHLPIHPVTAEVFRAAIRGRRWRTPPPNQLTVLSDCRCTPSSGDMTLPVSSYEELLARVRSLTHETIQLQRELTIPLIDHNENGEY